MSVIGSRGGEPYSSERGLSWWGEWCGAPLAGDTVTNRDSQRRNAGGCPLLLRWPGAVRQAMRLAALMATSLHNLPALICGRIASYGSHRPCKQGAATNSRPMDDLEINLRKAVRRGAEGRRGRHCRSDSSGEGERPSRDRRSPGVLLLSTFH